MDVPPSTPLQDRRTLASVLKHTRDDKNDPVGALDKLLDQCKQAIADVKIEVTNLTRENQRLEAQVARSSTTDGFKTTKPGSESVVEDDLLSSLSMDAVVPPGVVSHKVQFGEAHPKFVRKSESDIEMERQQSKPDFARSRRGSAAGSSQAIKASMDMLTDDKGYYYISPKWKEVQDAEPASPSRVTDRTTRAKVTWVEDSNVAIADVLGGLEPEVEKTTAPKKACPFLVSPDGPLRGCWDILSVVLVLYDIIVIPLQLLELPEDNGFLVFMAWVARLFWTFDIVMSSCSGYMLPNGCFVMDPKMIILRYLKTWFLLDAVIVGTDWSELFLTDDADSTASSAVRFSKASRGVRALRMLRLLRLLRLGNGLMIEGLFAFSALASQKMQLAGEILKITLFLMMLSHITGCLWYGVGASLAASNMASWVDVNSLQERSLGEKYIACVHWSLALLQGGSDEFPPRNAVERFYAVVILIITFLVSMGSLSRLTSSLTQLHIITSEHEVGLRMLRTYLSQNSISGKLAARISRSVKHSLSSVNHTIAEEQVKLLSHVSAHLRSELYFEIYGNFLCSHVFFGKYIEECPQVMRKVCRSAITSHCISAGDLIFSVGEKPENPVMYVLESGSLLYLAYTGRTAVVSNTSKLTQKHCDSSCFVAEGALWTAWVHMGMLKAANHVNLFEVDSTKFQRFSCEFHHTEFDPRVYAINFIKLLNWSVSQDIQVTDLATSTSELMLTLNFDPENRDLNDDLEDALDRETSRQAHTAHCQDARQSRSSS